MKASTLKELKFILSYVKQIPKSSNPNSFWGLLPLPRQSAARVADRGRCALWHNRKHLGVICEPAQSITKSNTISPPGRTICGAHFLFDPPFNLLDPTSTEQKKKETWRRRLIKLSRSGLRRKLRVCDGLTAEGLASPLVRVTRSVKWSQHPSIQTEAERRGRKGEKNK